MKEECKCYWGTQNCKLCNFKELNSTPANSKEKKCCSKCLGEREVGVSQLSYDIEKYCNDSSCDCHTPPSEGWKLKMGQLYSATFTSILDWEDFISQEITHAVARREEEIVKKMKERYKILQQAQSKVGNTEYVDGYMESLAHTISIINSKGNTTQK